MKKAIFLLLFLSSFIFAKAQNLPNFNRNYTFPGCGYLTFYDIHTTDTGYYFLGTMVDYNIPGWAGIFGFLEPSGDIRWVQNYASPDSLCKFSDMEVYNNQFLIGGGFGFRDSLGDFFNFSGLWLIDQYGDTIWHRKISYNNNPSGVLNVFRRRGNPDIFIRGGIGESGGANNIFYFAKLDSLGGILASQNIVIPNTVFNLYGSLQKMGDKVIMACSDFNLNTNEQRHFFYSKDTAFNTIDSI